MTSKCWDVGTPPRKSDVANKDVTLVKTAISIFKEGGDNARPVRVI